MRTDRLWDRHYLSRHSQHYGLLLLFALAAWSPQVLDTIGVVSLSLDNGTAFVICLLGNLYYFTSISVFFRHIGPWLRRRWGVANTLRLWEFYVSLAWQGQTIAFWVSGQFLFDLDMECSNDLCVGSYNYTGIV